MKTRLFSVVALFLVGSCGAWAEALPRDVLERMAAVDVVILGEVHDNPEHHENQRYVLNALKPKAVVWEMLTPVEASRISSSVLGEPDKLEKVLEWAQSGWPSFEMYYPIFAAAPEARIYGGEVPREAAVSVMRAGAAVGFGADAARYGLTVDLPAAEEAEREKLQFEAHCAAIPRSKLAAMVGIQRLRDAVLAREIIRAVAETGGPVAVITGNGHARRDWGIPVYLDRVQPDLRVFALGQSEDGQISGAFDAILDSPAVLRDDPCKGLLESD